MWLPRLRSRDVSVLVGRVVASRTVAVHVWTAQPLGRHGRIVVTASEDGWQPSQVGTDALVWVTVPGANVHLQIMKGWPSVIMAAVAADFNAYIEPLRDADSASWTPTNSVATSNHLNGTAMDLNWNSHAFHVRGTFIAAQMGVIRELLAFYEDTIFWAGDWDDPVDEMHWQMSYNTWNNPRVQDFINRKIRADGFSTFRRDNAPQAGNPALILSQATGLSLSRAAEILPAATAGLQAAECSNVNRIAMWLAQVGHESDNFNATEEYDKGDGGATERWKYLGRTWIQLTWLSNYLGFSKWCFDRGLVPTPTYFGDHPAELADLKWAGLGAAYYWTVARPDINALSDARDLVTVTQRINGGQNGIDDRRNRYNRALAVGDGLLQLLNGDDDMAQVSQDEWAEALDLLRQGAKYRRPSLSAFRHVGEGDVNTCMGFAWSADGSTHVALVERLAVEYGDPTQVALLMEVAGADVVKYPDRAWDAKLAARVLAKVSDTAKAEAKAQIQAWLAAEVK